MAKMTEEEAYELDELYTKTNPEFDPTKPGLFARQKSTVVVLDSFTSKYLTSKGNATKKSPAELISEMVRHELEAVG